MADNEQHTPEQLSNDIVKEALHELHTEVVNNVNISPVIDALFSVRDMHRLHLVDHRLDKCRQLLNMLYIGNHPRAFIELRQALKDDTTYDWLVEKIDDKYHKLIDEKAAAAATQPEDSEDWSIITLAQQDFEIIELHEATPLVDSLRRENDRLSKENAKLKYDIKRMYRERLSYEKNTLNIFDELRDKLELIDWSIM